MRRRRRRRRGSRRIKRREEGGGGGKRGGEKKRAKWDEAYKIIFETLELRNVHVYVAFNFL